MKVLALVSLLCVSLAVNGVPFKNGFEKPANGGKTWVVLAAGSNGWGNYRHQADVYHAYQIARSHGIPEENIIIFHYDDIAGNSDNPYPGKVFNKPSPRKDVYPGVPKDYTGDEVNPTNFLKALKGDAGLKANGKKVVESGPNDHIFIFFSDHGSEDLICFPDEYLHGKQLNDALKEMHANKRYGKLVFYIETCYAGSMFKNYLSKDMNIFATTAANEKESSWGCYCDESDIDTCLGDLYSVNWMEDSDIADMAAETLQKQYENVKQKTDKSHVCEWGDLSMGSLHLDQFQAALKGKQVPKSFETVEVPKNPVATPDIPIYLAKRRIAKANGAEELKKYTQQLEQILAGREMVDKQFVDFVDSVSHLVDNEALSVRREVTEQSGDCYRALVDTYHQKCMNIGQNTYALLKFQTFVAVCHQLGGNYAEAVDSLTTLCQSSNKADFIIV